MIVAPVLVAAVTATIPISGEVSADGGDYELIELEVPAGTAEIEIAHASTTEGNILDWGVWDPNGFRGWGGGLTENAIIGETEASRGYLPGPLPAGTWTLVIGKAKLVATPATYEITVTLKDAETLAPRERAPHDPVVLGSEPRWYAGDFHVHSRESGDATATFDEITDLARTRGLDFVALSDHNTVAQHALAAAYQDGVSDVLLLRSAEITTYGGHGNAFGFADYVDHRVGLDGVSATSIITDVADQGGLFSINHPVLDLGNACIGCAWEHEDTPWADVDAIEIHTGSWEATVGLFTPRAIALWDEQLDAGHRITAIAGSDDHRAGMDLGSFGSPIGSPTTLVYAAELSEAAILEAVRAGRVQVLLRGPDDPRLELTATGSDGLPAGLGETTRGHEVTLDIAVVPSAAAAGLDVLVYQDGEPVDVATVSGDDFTASFTYPVPEGGARFRAHLVDGALDVTVTNHVWVEHEPAPGGCGCTGTGGNDGPGVALVLAMFVTVALRRSRAAAPVSSRRQSARVRTNPT